jgi:hypothetical protein
VGQGAAARALAIAACVLLGACTEPNPYLPVGDAGSGASTSTGPSTSLATGEDTSGTDGDDATASGGGELPCIARGMICMEPAPEGFVGPFAWLERSVEVPPMDCAAPFDQPLFEAFSELSAPAATCECTCGPLGNAECGPASVARHSGVSCGGAVQDTLGLDPGCNQIAGVGWASSTSFFFDAPAVDGGGCVPLPSVEIEPAGFLTRHLACAGTLATDGCDAGRLCAPQPDEPYSASVCVLAEGDVACPEGSAYVDRTLLHRDIEDQRGCEQCACEVPTVPCEGTSLALSTALTCNSGLTGVPPDDCVGDIPGPILHGALFTEGTVPAGLECEPAVVVPTGEAAGIDPVTFCCTR